MTVAKAKNKRYKKVGHERKLILENYKHWLEASQLENKRNHLEQNKIDIDCIKVNHKEFTKKQ